ncbi:MAG: DJ-1/PfpI family protein [Armatimonadetes bacterium]|nr:DJ-1/PfpI family protein [Armatimonadota bacterium]
MPLVIGLLALILLPGCPSSARLAGTGGGVGPSAAPVAPPQTPPGPEAAASAEQPAETTGEKAEENQPDLTGKRVVMVVAPDKFRDEEFEIPYETLSRYGAKVTVVSLTKGECVGVKGTKVQAVKGIAEIKAADYDALVFAGGPGMVKHLNEPRFVAAAQAFAKAGKLVAAICVSPVILANAGILKGHKATCWSSMKPKLAEKGAEPVDKDVVVEGKLITGSGPPASTAFARAIAAVLAAEE